MAASDLPHVFATFEGDSETANTATIEISRQEFSLVGRKARIGFAVEAIDVPVFDPSAAQISDSSGAIHPAYKSDDLPDGSSSVALFDLRYGSYEIQVDGEGSGAFQVSVFLVGDLNGDRRVNWRDALDFSRHAYEILRDSSTPVRGEADADLDGSLRSSDFFSLIHNYGDRTHLQPIQLDVTGDSTELVLPDGSFATSQETYSVSGSASTNPQVEFTLGPQPAVPISLESDGTFAIQANLSEGNNQLEFVAMDSFGQRAIDGFEILLDTVAPSVDVLSDIPLVTSENVTISGNVSDGGVGVDGLFVSVDGQPGTPISVQSDGSFSFTTLFPLDGSADGNHSLVFSTADLLGNSAQGSAITFELKTATQTDPPGAFDITSPAEFVSTASPTISWSPAEFAETYNVSIARNPDGTEIVQSATALTSTNYFADPLTDGTYYVAVTAVNANGSTRATNNGNQFTVDFSIPNVSAALSNDSGSDPTDGLTNDATISGSATDLVSSIASLDARLDGGPIQSVAFGIDGSFSYSPALALDGTDDGLHSVEFIATDLAGNTSSTTVAFELDSQPAEIIDFDLAASSDSGTIGDQTTVNEFVNLVGQTDANQLVQLLTPSRSTTSNSLGHFQFNGLQLPLGAREFQVSTVDAAGNMASSTLTINRTPRAEATVLRESDGLLVEAFIPFATSTDSGRQTLRFELEATLGAGQDNSLIGDLFLVSIVDTSSNATLLDHATVFSLSGSNADFPAGLVRFDGEAVEIDVTDLAGDSNLALRLQLLSGEDSTSSIVEVGAPKVTREPDAEARPRLNSRTLTAAAGGSADVSGLTVAGEIEAQLTQLVFDAATRELSGRLQLVNNGEATGRQLFVFFPNLPGGVALQNPSGVDGGGGPYLNLTPATLSGGLDTGGSTLSVPVAFTTDLTQSFELNAEVRSAGPNQRPTLAPIANTTAPIGTITEIALDAADSDGDLLWYSVRSDTRLPNIELTGDGRMLVNPSPGMEGDYTFQVVVSDGFLKAEQTVNLSVALESTANTTISGFVLDIDDNPIPGVPVQVGRFQSTTDATGAFSVELPSFVTPTEAFEIEVPTADPQFDPFGTGQQTIELRRAGYDPSTGDSLDNPRLHPNLISAFIDGSVVYGSDAARATALRTLDGTGKLKTGAGDLLPFNSPAFFPDGMLENENSSQRDPSELFAAGDVRSNDNVGLMSLHTVMTREHNRRADELAAANPSLTGEELYQQARRWTTALLQHITYQEYLPLLLGPNAIPAYGGYDSSIDPQISGIFSGAAFRIGHSMSPGELLRLNEDGTPTTEGPVSLVESFFNPDLIVQEGIEPFLLGMSKQPIEAVDTQLRDELRNFLFGPPGAGGLDLISLNIQRGRDLGLPSYNQARSDFGLAAANSFADVTSDATVQAELAAVYATVDDLDVIVGGLAEDHPAGSLVGELFGTILGNQFARSRDGDRFWYENEQFTQTDLDAIRSTTLAELIVRNTNISSLPASVFTTGTQAASPGAGGAAAANQPAETPSFDGTGNNLSDPTIGSARQSLRVDYTLDYGDGISTPAGADRPSAREISNAVFAQPSSQLDPSGATTMLMLWGQLLAHDVSLTPGGTDDTIKIVGNADSVAANHPFVAESLPEILHREVYLGLDNQLPRPIYLPVIDTGQAVTIDPNSDTAVSIEVRSGAAPVQLTVSAGTAVGQDGEPFSGDLSITEVPPDRLPMALPPTLFPEMVVTIQPAGIAFANPLAVTFPNSAGFAPGQEADLWSLDPETGKFAVVGKMQTSADGSVVSTIEGGIQTASWHFTLTPDTPVSNGPKTDGCGGCGAGGPSGTSGGEPPEVADPPIDVIGMGLVAPERIGGGEATASSNSEVGLLTGALYEEHTTGVYRSLGKTRSVQLVYDSRRADPRPIVTLNALGVNQLSGRASAVGPDGVTYNSTSTDATGFSYWNEASGVGMRSASLQLDLRDAPSGIFDTAFLAAIGSGAAGRELNDRLVSINAIESPFGAGWGLAGLQYVVEDDSGAVVIVDGNGNDWLYDRQPDGSYAGPVSDFGILEKLSDGRFRYTSTDQTVNQYDSDGRMESVTDRNGNQTTYQYDATGRIIAIVDPAGLTTTLRYTNEKVSEIEDPAGRITSMDYDSAGNLIRVTDPDASTRVWEYDLRHHMTAETDQRGFREETRFGYHGRVIGATRKDGTEMQFVPQVVRALTPAERMVESGQGGILTAYELTATVVDASGQVQEIDVAELGGGAAGASDGISRRNQIDRNEDNLISAITNGRGQRTDFSYDANGNLAAIADTLSLGRETDAWFFDTEPFGGAPPVAFDATDLNADGILDIVAVAEVTNNTLNLITLEGRPGGAFTNQRVYSSAGDSFAIADFNQDEVPDVAVSGSFSTIIYLNVGDGTLVESQSISLPQQPFVHDVGDFNNDGLSDLLIDSNAFVGVALGNGDGTLGQVQQIYVPISEANVFRTTQVADLNGDGFDDVVAARVRGDFFDWEQKAYVLMNDGVGGFAPAVEYDLSPPTGGGRWKVFDLQLVDLDSDGPTDIIAWIGQDGGGGRLVVLPGTGDGTFETQESQDLSFTNREGQMAIGDIDKNGELDVVFPPLSLLQQTDGSFVTQGQTISALAGPATLKDFNQDGELDLLARSELFRGRGQGQFFAYQPGIAIGSGFAIADFNSDGQIDVVRRSGNELRLSSSNSEGEYDDEFLLTVSIQSDLVTGDFNGDSHADFASSSSSYLGDGTGGFTAQSFATTTFLSNPNEGVGDYNNDGWTDFIAQIPGDQVAVHLSNGDGTFSASGTSAPLPMRFGRCDCGFDAADMNADGNLDLVLLANAAILPETSTNSIYIYLGDGAGGLTLNDTQAAFPPTSQAGRVFGITAADFDDDGLMEIAVSGEYRDDNNEGLTRLRIWHVTGEGFIEEPYLERAYPTTGDVNATLASGDLNNDGIDDLVAVSVSRSFIFPGSGDDSLLLTPVAFDVTDERAMVIDADNDGDLDLVSNFREINIVENVLNGESSQPWRFEYDETFSQLTRVTDGIGRTTLYEIDPANGNRLSETRVVGELDSPENGEDDDVVTTYSYTPQGQMDTMTDPLGRVTDYDYDSLGRLTSVTYAVGTTDQATVRLEYDAATQAGQVGLLTAWIDENGNRTEYEYDSLNRLTQITEADPDGASPLSSPVTTYAYDPTGNMTEMVDAEGSTMRYEYDELGRRVSLTDSLSQTTQFFYDEVGKLVATVNPLSHVSRAVYDARGRIVESIDENGDSTFFGYDFDDNLLRLTDPVGNTTQFRYDQRNRQLQEIDPLGNRISNEYDTADQLIRRTDRNNRVIDFSYDDLGRRVDETWRNPDATVVNEWHYAYAPVGNLLSAEDAESSFSYTYDARDRVVTKDNLGTPNAPNVVLTYTYDGVGNVLSVADAIEGAAGATTTYQYDALNRVAQMTQSGNDTSDKRVDLAYNELGQFETIDRYGDLTGQNLIVGTRYQYDDSNRLVDLRHTNASAVDLAFYEYEYDPSSRIRQITSGDGVADYAYDATDQLIGSEYSDQGLTDETYKYDENGNRVNSHLHGTGYVTGDANRLLSDGTYDYEYDQEGNMILRTEIATGDYREFQWDHRNRLVAVNDFEADGTPTQVVEFTYDFLNRRIAKSVDANPADTVAASVTHFVVDRDDVILDLVDSDGAGPGTATPEQRYLQGPKVDQILAQESSLGRTLWHLSDHLGTVRDLGDESGLVVNHLVYDGFGQVVSQTDAGMSSRYLYTGREYDAEIELSYYRARYLDSTIGRFQSEDPLRRNQSDTNLFRYVTNNPAMSTDPFGLHPHQKDAMIPGDDGLLTGGYGGVPRPDGKGGKSYLPKPKFDFKNLTLDFGCFKIGTLDNDPIDTPGERQTLRDFKNKDSGVQITIPF